MATNRPGLTLPLTVKHDDKSFLNQPYLCKEVQESLHDQTFKPINSI